MAYKCSTLTATELNYPAHVLVVVHALCAFLHYLLGGGALQQAGCWSNFDLQMQDGQPGHHVAQDEQASEQYVR